VFHRWLPAQSTACSSRLDRFFAQWFDTAYEPGGRARRPHITGPGLAGPRFYTAGCTRGAPPRQSPARVNNKMAGCRFWRPAFVNWVRGR
jgi:hypothetical protein